MPVQVGIPIFSHPLESINNSIAQLRNNQKLVNIKNKIVSDN